MKKLFLLFGVVGMIFTACNNGDFGNDEGEILDPNNPLNNHKCASNEILYISKSCATMELGNSNGWGANLVSNTYDNGVGRLKFDATVTAIPVRAFAKDFGYNEMLMYIKMPNTITSIGYWAFRNCSSLTSITIPDSVTSIGEGAFRYCYSLTSITIPDSVTEIGWYAFSDCSSLTSITIPDSVTSIGDEAFYDCESLTSVTIGNGVTSIGDGAFCFCSSLTSVTIPDSVVSVGYKAFSYCSSLTSVTIGNGVTSIGYYAFHGCESLTSVYCKPTTPPIAAIESYYWDTFENNASERKIYVPRNSVEAYKSAKYWRDYASDIVGYDF